MLGNFVSIALAPVTLGVALVPPLVRQSAPPAPAWVDRVDRLFAEWDRPDSPGCALGVIQGGKLVHARGFGAASLEHRVPITALGLRHRLDYLPHHTSGLPDYRDLMDAAPPDWTMPEDALAALAEVKALRFPPGTKLEYSNSNYFLLSLVGARAAEVPFDELVQRHLFEPLGMRATLLWPPSTTPV